MPAEFEPHISTQPLIPETGDKETTRREFLQGTTAEADSLPIDSVVSARAAAQPTLKRPNLVFFLGEGQPQDALLIAGNPIVKPPTTAASATRA
jgi:hypothetical protein